jgi:hypothetical protein
MRYDYQGFWSNSFCDIEVHRRTDGKYVFVATELRDNPGTSVTNFAEHLATAMCKQHRLKPEDVIWIEHYPEAKDSRKDSTLFVFPLKKTLSAPRFGPGSPSKPWRT